MHAHAHSPAVAALINCIGLLNHRNTGQGGDVRWVHLAPHFTT